MTAERTVPRETRERRKTLKHETIVKRDTLWQRLFSKKELVQDEKVVYVAGGGLAALMGDDTSKIWELVDATLTANKGVIEFAGKIFTREQLLNIGAFYRGLKAQGKILKCVDERLDLAHAANSEVHCRCGMCGAVGKAVEKAMAAAGITMSMEDLLAKELGDANSPQEKQNLLAGTEDNHESITINVSLGKHHMRPSAEHLPLLKDGALAFNVSLPVSEIETFLLENEKVDVNSFLTALVDWSPAVARTIIGHHNRYDHLADESTQMFFHVPNEVSAKPAQDEGSVLSTLFKIIRGRVPAADYITVPSTEGKVA